MKPKVSLDLDPDRFAVFKAGVRHAIEAERARHRGNSALPDVLGIKLTNRCNLRCSHCYQWNEDGYHHALSEVDRKADLSLELFRRLLKETRDHRSRLYLWGGEPLSHRQILPILAELRNDAREVTICTNGHMIGRYHDSLSALGGRLELLVALDGFEAQHDAIRGPGSFKAVMANVDRLLEDRRNQKFVGKVTVHVVINNQNLSNLHEFVQFLAQKMVDLVLVTFPWYIAPETSKAMDDYVALNFGWLIGEKQACNSWDAFKYHLDPTRIPVLMDQLALINEAVWPMTVRYQPELNIDEIEGFVRGLEMVVKEAPECNVLTTRIDVGPTGKATACKFFSEFVVGDLQHQTLAEVWNGDAYAQIRRTLGKGLTPACSKCNVLHLQKNSVPVHF